MFFINININILKKIINNKLKNKGNITIKFLKRYNVKKVTTLTYYLKANKIIKKKYKFIVNALFKLIKRVFTN